MVVFDFFLQPFKNMNTVLSSHRLNKSRLEVDLACRL